jgi:hypothetical protein
VRPPTLAAPLNVNPLTESSPPPPPPCALQKLHETDLEGRTINVRIATPRAPRPAREYGDRPQRDYGDRPPRGDRYGSEGGYERRERREPRGDRPQRNPDAQLYVGNLSWSTTWQVGAGEGKGGSARWEGARRRSMTPRGPPRRPQDRARWWPR